MCLIYTKALPTGPNVQFDRLNKRDFVSIIRAHVLRLGLKACLDNTESKKTSSNSLKSGYKRHNYPQCLNIGNCGQFRRILLIIIHVLLSHLFSRKFT